MKKSWAMPMLVIPMTVFMFVLTLAGPAVGAEDTPDGQRAMASNQSIPCAFRARVVEIKRLDEPLPPKEQLKGYVIDAEPRWELTLEVLTHASKTPFQPGIRHCYIADPAAVFGVPADKVQGFHEFSYTWNIDVEGKPEFEAFKARALTPAERGLLRAQADIEAGTPRIVYSGMPRSADKAPIDPETGLPLLAAGCVVTDELLAKQDAYNKTIKAAFNQTGGWGEASGGLQLRIWTAKRTYEVGGQIEVNFILKNVSQAPLTVLDGTGARGRWMHRFTFTDADGNAIAFKAPEPASEEKATTSSEELAPCGCVRRTVALNDYRLGDIGRPYTEIGKEARTILVTGTHSTPVGGHMPKGVWQGSVTSKPVRIEIVE